MTRVVEDPSALRPPGETQEEDVADSLFERWLARPGASRRRMRAAPALPTAPPLGDDLADAWFK
jgi:hypothetical protein